MFQFLQAWDGVRVAKFGVEHIGYIRKAMLYSQLTSRKYCLDLTSLLIFVDKGCFGELLHAPFYLFYCLLLASASYGLFLLVCLVKFVIQNGCVYLFVVLVRCILFFGQVSCIVLYKWAALLYTSGLHCCIHLCSALMQTSGLHCCRQEDCIDVDQWTTLMQTSGLHSVLQ